jgi:hypothetical protein
MGAPKIYTCSSISLGAIKRKQKSTQRQATNGNNFEIRKHPLQQNGWVGCGSQARALSRVSKAMASHDSCMPPHSLSLSFCTKWSSCYTLSLHTQQPQITTLQFCITKSFSVVVVVVVVVVGVLLFSSLGLESFENSHSFSFAVFLRLGNPSTKRIHSGTHFLTLEIVAEALIEVLGISSDLWFWFTRRVLLFWIFFFLGAVLS